MCPITINTWEQLTKEGKAVFKELELDKNPAVTLYVCEVQVPSDESCNNKTVFIDNPASLIAVFKEAKNTGKENVTVTIIVQSDDSTCTGRSWNLLLGLPRNCTLGSLTLTINNFSPRSTELSFTQISFFGKLYLAEVAQSDIKRVQQALEEYLCIPSARGLGTQHLTDFSDFDTQHLR